MITAKSIKGYGFTIQMDAVDQVVITRLAEAYGLSKTAMLIACIYKGITHIEQHIHNVDEHEKLKHDNREPNDLDVQA